MNIFEFMAQNPVLTFLIVGIVSDGVVRIAVAFALALHNKRKESDE